MKKLIDNDRFIEVMSSLARKCGSYYAANVFIRMVRAAQAERAVLNSTLTIND